MAVQAVRLGAAGCMIKCGDYLQRLVVTALAILEDAVNRRSQLREMSAMRATEMRLRLLIESIPACVVLLAVDGLIQAMNWAGLPLIGANRTDLGWGVQDNDSLTYFVLNGFDLEKNASVAFSMRQDNKTSFEVSASNKTSLFDFGGAFINSTFRKAVGMDDIQPAGRLQSHL